MGAKPKVGALLPPNPPCVRLCLHPSLVSIAPTRRTLGEGGGAKKIIFLYLFIVEVGQIRQECKKGDGCEAVLYLSAKKNFRALRARTYLFKIMTTPLHLIHNDSWQKKNQFSTPYSWGRRRNNKTQTLRQLQRDIKVSVQIKTFFSEKLCIRSSFHQGWRLGGSEDSQTGAMADFVSLPRRQKSIPHYFNLAGKKNIDRWQLAIPAQLSAAV